MLEYEVFAQRLSAQGRGATIKCAAVALDTNLDGRWEVVNPAAANCELTCTLRREQSD